MANYILNYKGKYRILPELDLVTHDFLRNPDGSLDDSDIYISCRQGNKIYSYGHVNNSKAVWLVAYIPSVGRGRNIKKILDEKGVQYERYFESDSEVEFQFLPKDIDIVANLLKAKVGGAGISPFSTRNLSRSNIEIPTEKIALYKEISSLVKKEDLLILHNITNDFLDTVLQKSIRKSNNKKFDYKQDIRKQCMARQAKIHLY